MKKTLKPLTLLSLLFFIPLIVASLFVVSTTRVSAYSEPSAWSGTCDNNRYSTNKTYNPTGVQSKWYTSWSGIDACGPRPYFDSPYIDVPETLGGFGEFEFECTELAMRYLTQAFGISGYSANGINIVDNFPYGGTHFTKVSNNSSWGSSAVNNAPVAGDVISFYEAAIDANANGSNGDAGHVAIVSKSTPLSGTGNYTLTLMDQNDSTTGSATLTVSNWVVGQLSSNRQVKNWMHNPTGTQPSLQMSTAINPSSPVTMGGSFSASYTVYNPGDTNMNLTQLSLWGKDPNGTTFMLYGDNPGGSNIYVGSHNYRTLSFSGLSFASGCSNCANGGNYQLLAEWQDVNRGQFLNVNPANGISNTITISVTSLTPNPIHVGQVDVGVNSGNGTAQAFKLNSDGTISTNAQNGTNSQFSGWNVLSGMTFATEPNVTLNAQNELQAYALGVDSKVYANWENAAGNGSSWYGWVQMPNTPSNDYFSGNPVSVQMSNGYQDVFVRGQNNSIWHMYQTGGSTWSSWNTISGNIYGDPTVVQNKPGGEQIFIRGTDNKIYTSWQTTPGDSSSWTGYTQQGNQSGLTFASNPVAYKESNGYMDVFVLGADNNIWHTYQDSNGNWQNWSAISLSGNITYTGTPAIVQNRSGGEQVFATGTDHNVYTASETTPGNSSSWSAWSLLSTGNIRLSGSPTAINQSNGFIDVYGRSLYDNGMWHIVQNTDGSWQVWEPTTTTIGSNDVERNIDGSLQVFRLNANGSISTNWQNNGTWTGWSTLNGNGVTFTSQPSVILNQVGELEVYALGSDSKIYTAWENNMGSGNSWLSFTMMPNTPSNYNFSGTPVVIQMQNSYMDVFVRGQDNNIWHEFQTAPTNWTNWEPITLSGNTVSFNGDPTIVQNQSGGLELYAVSSQDNTVYTNWENNAGDVIDWGSWSQLPNTPNGYTFFVNPSSIKQNNAYMDVYIVGSNNNVWHMYQTGGSTWSNWTQVSTTGQVQFKNTPAVIQNQPGGLQTYALGTDNNLYSAWENTPGNESSWSNWNEMPTAPSGVTFTGSPVVVSQSNGYMDVYMNGSDGNLYHDTQTGSSQWTGWVSI